MKIKEIQRVTKDDSLGFILQNMWDNVLHKQIFKDNIIEVTLDVGLTHTYEGNFYGLLSNEYNIPQAYWYPNLRLNKFDNSASYKAEITFKLYKSEILEKYREYFLNELKEKVKYGIEVG